MFHQEHLIADGEAYLEVAVRAAERATAIVRDMTGHAAVHHKSYNDLVTDGDRAAERAIIDTIRESFPEHGILAEESGESRSSGPVRWLIDPIDGTTNFAHGLPLFAISVAVALGDSVIAGVISNPESGEMYTACRTKGAWLGATRLRVSDTKRLSDSLLATDPPRSAEKYRNLDHIRSFDDQCHGVRTLGCAAISLAYLARGLVDGFWHLQLDPWDYAAGRLLVEEAGGVLSDLQATPLSLRTQGIVASNGEIHSSMCTVLDQSNAERQ